MSTERSTARRTCALLIAFAAAGTLSTIEASGQQLPPSASQLAQAGRTATFNIPAQPLAQALTTLGQQAGIQVAVNASAVVGKTSAPVSGTMTVDQALQMLLSGTGIAYRFTSPTMVSITGGLDAGGAMLLDPVQVQGFPVPQQAMIDNLPPPYAGGQVATGGQLGLLGNRGVMDTPFNQTNFTTKKAQDQQAKTVKDVLIDDPSVRAIRADSSPGGDSVRIRGFTVQNAAISYGGLYGVLPNESIMAELAERVEVLKGPSAMLNGMQPTGSIGGVINIVPKRAPVEPLTQLTANYVSGAQFGGHVDIARRFGPENEFGVRFNGVFRDGQTDIQWNTDERALALLGLDFRGERARFSADFGYQSRYIGGATGYIALANGVPLPWAPNARNNPAGQPFTEVQTKDLFGTFRAEVDLTDRVTAYASLGAHDLRFGSLQTGLTVNNVNGAATSRGQLNNSYSTFQTAIAGIRALVDTGPIGHEFAFSATTFKNENGDAIVQGAPFVTNIYSPTIIARPSIATPVTTKTSTQQLSSLGVADTLSAADKRLQLTVGARLQRVEAANFNAATGLETSSYDESAISPSVALVFKPWQNVSIYGNWIQGLQQGAIVPQQFTNAGEVFPPFKSTQYEAGVKVDWGKLTTTVSLFQINQPSILTDVATNMQFLGGEQVNQGLELNFFGEVTEGFRVLGGAMFLNGVLTKTQGGATNGWIAPFTPGAQFNLASEWDLPFVNGLPGTGRVTYTGAQFVDTRLPRRMLPEWTLFDLGARYTFENPGAKGKLLVARFNVDNVLDANYWSGGNNVNTLNLGAPRTFRLSLTADF